MKPNRSGRVGNPLSLVSSADVGGDAVDEPGAGRGNQAGYDGSENCGDDNLAEDAAPGDTAHSEGRDCGADQSAEQRVVRNSRGCRATTLPGSR